MVYFQYNGYGFLAGHRYTFRWVSNSGCGLRFDEYGDVDFNSSGYGENAKIRAQLEREYNRFFCCPDVCGGFSCWVSGLGTVTEKPKTADIDLYFTECEAPAPVLAGVEVSGLRVSGKTGADGHFKVTEQPYGTYTITASREGYVTWAKDIIIDVPIVSAHFCMTKGVTPPAPPPPPLEPVPPPAECDKVAWYDIPKGLLCVFKSIMALPGNVGDFIMRKWVEYLWKRYVLTATAVMKRARSPGEWTSEEIKVVTGLEGVAPEIMTVNFIEGLLASFVSGPNKDRLMATMYERDPAKIPSPSDLVRMELREVFKKDERAEQMIPKPSEDFYTYMKPIGLDKFWADSYWAAHWELPSVTQGYEMYHRLRPGKSGISSPFTKEDLKKLLVRQDVLQRYQDQLIDIAYLPLTRVDVRRMYGLGVLTASQVYEAYLDLGYNPTDAANLRDFTIKYESKEEARLRELPLGDQEKLLAGGKRTPDQLASWMRKIGYSETAITDEKDLLTMITEPLAKEKRAKELSLTDWEKLLYENKLLWSEIKARMIELGYSARAQKDELMIVQLEASKKWAAAYIARTLTLEDLKKRLKTIELTDKEILELTAKLKLGV